MCSQKVYKIELQLLLTIIETLLKIKIGHALEKTVEIEGYGCHNANKSHRKMNLHAPRDRWASYLSSREFICLLIVT